MLILLVDFMKIFLLTGLIFAVSNLVITRLLMPKIFWLIALFVQLSFLLMLHGIEFISFVVLLLYVGAISVLFLFVVMILNPDAKRNLSSNNGAGTTGAESNNNSEPFWVSAYYRLTIGATVVFFALLVADAYVLEFTASLSGLWTEFTSFAVEHKLEAFEDMYAGSIFQFSEYLETFHNPWYTKEEWRRACQTEIAWLQLMESKYFVLSSSVPVPGVVPTSDLWVIAESFYTQDFVLFWLVGLILLISMVGAIVLTLQKSRGIKRQKGTNQSKRYHALGR